MSQHEKLLKRLKGKPRDFEWSEVIALLGHFGFVMLKGTGSRRKFVHEASGVLLILHEPHPEKTIQKCYTKYIIDALTEGGFLK